MSDKNFLKLSAVYGKLALANVTTSYQTVVTNAANSNTAFRINTIFLSNNDQYNTVVANVTLQRPSNGRTEYIGFRESLRNLSTSKILSRTEGIYLQEGDYIEVQANANNKVHCIISYEVIA
jgi:hypothetical protein